MPGPGRMGAGPEEGIPSSSRGARLGFPGPPGGGGGLSQLPPLTFAPSAEHEGLAPPAAGSGVTRSGPLATPVDRPVGFS